MRRSGLARVRGELIGKYGRVMSPPCGTSYRDKNWREIFERLVHCGKEGKIAVSVYFSMKLRNDQMTTPYCSNCYRNIGTLLGRYLDRWDAVSKIIRNNYKVSFEVSNGMQGVWFVECLMRNFEPSLCDEHKKLWNNGRLSIATVVFSFQDYSASVRYFRH